MKTINKYFSCSDDAEYSLTNENMCNVSKGEVHTKMIGSIIFATGENTSAHANNSFCHVYASHPTAHAYANYRNSTAYALVKGSHAHATVEYATAYGTCIGSNAISTNGGSSVGKF